MSKLTLTMLAPDSYSLTGDMTFAGIDRRTVDSFKLLKASNQLSIDLAAVTVTDSAGLALMIEWIKFSNRQGILLKFKNIPVQLISLAKLCGLDQIAHFTITND
ncbi:MAG: STAS domain-containing protein [Methylomonas sp.]|jgi:phospholipid transport system transporter-binding protein